MRLALASLIALAATPAFAQFPPPGIYTCMDSNGGKIGVLSLLAAGDYQWDTPDGQSATGQVSSASTRVTALTGPLAEGHWTGEFSAGDRTVFHFKTDTGTVTCR